ncbi:MAG: ABC transporter permease [Gemmatimonadetes bacterium]|jgi:putative ABC transport system permease protein|nr:ABC transporter permease [Gemmatimonadota bacterium]
MNFLEAVRLALDTIRVQKLKSFFTLTGVMIGVMFLIAVISIVEGMSRYVEEDFAAKLLGVNTFTLRRRPFVQVGGVSEEQFREFQRRPRLYDADVAVVRSTLPRGARSAIENVTFANASVPNARPKSVQTVATEPDYFRIKKYDLSAGRAFTQQEADLGLPVAVIGAELVESFFADLDPIGREVRVGGIPYRVIGVIEKQGMVFGFSLDRLFIAPYRSPLSRVTNPRGDIGGLIVQTPTREEMDGAMEDAREAMRGARNLRPGQGDNFTFESQDQALAFFDGIKSKLIVFGTALPAIGLVVGAMVIMNIMLVAVAERTREIGIRKALGARRRDIMMQFLIEAATLSILGAAIGIGLGFGLAKVIAAVSPLPAAVAPWAIGAALVLGAGVGIAAGLYPASRAALLDPIAALRQE